VVDVGIDEREWSRLGPQIARPQKYTAWLIGDAAWAEPTRDPFSEDYRPKHPIQVDIGIMTPQGWEIMFERAYAYAMLGACKGCFFTLETVEVEPWPFRDAAYLNPKWLIRGIGQLTCWTEYLFGKHTILVDRYLTSGSGMPRHVMSFENGNDAGGHPWFPAAKFPRSLDPGTLANKETEWRWADAEGLWYPLLQAPVD
jgi:hypothetical protein